MRAVLMASTFMAVTALALPARAQGVCGTTEELDPGETVAQLAERCGTTVGAILKANDAKSVEDLDTSAPLSLVAVDTPDAANTSGQAAGTAGDEASEATENAGDTVDKGTENAGSAAREAADATGEAVEKTGEAIDKSVDEDAVKKAAKDAGEAAGNALDKTGEALDKAVDEDAVKKAAKDAADAAGNALDKAGKALDKAVDKDTIDKATDTAADWLSRARDAVQEAGRQIDEAATDAGRSASDYLSQNPDLNQDIIRLGESIGLPGVASKPWAGPDLAASPAGDGKVHLEASGLPGNAEVRIGVLSSTGVDVIETGTTDKAGDLTVDIDAPAASGGETVFVVETANGRVRLASDPYVAK